MARVALTLGPLFFHWPAERLRNFYFRIADEAAVERVHVDEVVCGKRMPFSDPVWPEIIERLERGGKEVVLSTLAAPATVRERKAITELCTDGRLVEINDITALPARSGRPFVTGPFLNVYNEATARYLVRHGATTICPPVELSLDTVGTIASACPEVEFELFAFGRLPLALSGRCYHARLQGCTRIRASSPASRTPTGCPSTRSTTSRSWPSTASRPCQTECMPRCSSLQTWLPGTSGGCGFHRMAAIWWR